MTALNDADFEEDEWMVGRESDEGGRTYDVVLVVVGEEGLVAATPFCISIKYLPSPIIPFTHFHFFIH